MYKYKIFPNGLVLYLVLLTLLSPLSNCQLATHDLTEYYDESSQNVKLNPIKKKIKEVMDYSFERSIPPLTARVIMYPPNGGSSDMEFDWNLVSCWPKIVGDERPTVPSLDPRRLGVGDPGSTEIFRYVIIMWLFDVKAIPHLQQNIKGTFNRRWDRIILIGPEAIVSKMWWVYEFQDLKERTAIVYETGELWVDPFVYDNGRMDKIKSMSEKKSLITKMGANLRGRHLKVAGCEWPPWIFWKSGPVGKEILAGNHYNIIKAAAKIFNYTFETAYWGVNYGEHLENDTWIGMYAGVFYPENGYHLTFFLSHDIVWSYGVDYPSTITTADIIFVTGHPRTEIPLFAFLLPFTNTVWIWVICSFIACGLVQGFIMWLRVGRKWKYIVYDSAVFLPYAMATEQGLCDIPSGARLTSLVWLLGCVVLGTGYRSTLRANIAFPKPEVVPLTYEELGNRPDYFTTLHTQGAVETTYIKGTQDRNIQKIRRTIKYEKDDEKCVLNAILTRKTTCITWSPFIEQVIARTFTKNSKVDPLKYSSNAAKRVTMSLAFQKNSMYVDSFFGITAGTAESGILRKWEYEVNQGFKDMGVLKLKTMKGTPLYNELTRLENIDDSDKPLTTENLKIVFAILPLGIFLSIILFGVERLYWSCRTNPKLWTEVYANLFEYRNKIFRKVKIQDKKQHQHNMKRNAIDSSTGSLRASTLGDKQSEKTSKEDESTSNPPIKSMSMFSSTYRDELGNV